MEKPGTTESANDKKRAMNETVRDCLAQIQSALETAIERVDAKHMEKVLKELTRLSGFISLAAKKDRPRDFAANSRVAFLAAAALVRDPSETRAPLSREEKKLVAVEIRKALGGGYELDGKEVPPLHR